MKRFEKAFTGVFANFAIFAVLLGIFTLSLSAASSFTSSGADKEKAVYKGDVSKSNAAIMINVYWGTEYIDAMLDILDANGAKATFFVGGTWVAQNNSVLIKIKERGHEIGNHGYYHKDHKKLSAQRNREEIFVTHKLVESVANVPMNLFAPPSGAFNQITLDTAKELGYKTIMWSIDPIDWRDKDENLIYNRVAKKVGAGDLILMHPTECTVKALDKILKHIKSKNLNPTTVSNTL